MKKITSLLLVFVMLFVALTLSGCKSKYNYVGYPIGWQDFPLSFCLNSETNIFPINNVVINISYGFHKLTLWGAVKNDPKENYPYADVHDNYASYKFEFEIYVCNDIREDRFEEIDFTNMLNAKEYTFIKKIGEQAAFSNEYGYRPWWIDTNYNHTEQITIPKEYFNNYLSDTWGRFAVIIACIAIKEESGVRVYVCGDKVAISYSKIDDDTVKLSFD